MVSSDEYVSWGKQTGKCGFLGTREVLLYLEDLIDLLCLTED